MTASALKTKEKPPRTNVMYMCIPDELKALPQWVVWRYGLNSKKDGWTKPLHCVLKPMVKASSTDPKTWATYEMALAAFEKNPTLDGIGFVFTINDPYVGIDLDHCRSLETGNYENWAEEIIAMFPGAHCEITPSGTGCHIIIKGQLHGRGGKRGFIECYEWGRYFTMTGQALPSSGMEIAEHQAALDVLLDKYFKKEKNDEQTNDLAGHSTINDDGIIDLALSATNGEAFRKLWEGNTSGHTSPSEADLSFCVRIAFYSNHDAVQIDRLYRRSKLFRDKWDHKHGAKTYGAMTIEKAILLCKETYTPGGSNTPAEWPELVPLNGGKAPEIPDDILPGHAGDFAREAARAIQVPYSMAAAAVMGVVSLAACSTVRVLHVGPGHDEPLNEYLIAPLLSGERKTSMVGAATSPLYEWEKEQAELKLPTIKAARSRRKSQERIIEARRTKAAKIADNSERKALIAEIAKEEAALEDVPNLPRLLADDITPEKLAGLMESQGEVLGIITSEGGFFDLLGGRYSRDGSANLDLFLKAHCAESYRVDRMGRDPLMLSKPRLVACICPQPEVLISMAGKPGFRGRGVLSRFLYFFSESKVGYRDVSPDPIPQRVAGEYSIRIKTLLDMRGANLEFTLSPAARTVWLSFAQAVEEEMRPGGEFEHFRDWAGKLPGQAARIAGIFHCIVANLPGELMVSEESMKRALDMATILADHAKVAFSTMGSDPDTEVAKAILEWIQRTKRIEFTLRDCFRDLDGRYRNITEIKPGLNVLVERGYLIEKGTVQVGRGRPRGPMFIVNPIIGGVA